MEREKYTITIIIVMYDYGSLQTVKQSKIRVTKWQTMPNIIVN